MKKYEVLSVILIFIAEIMLFSNNKNISVVIHGINIFLLIMMIVLKKDVNIVQAVALVSLLRIVNISTPVFFSPTIYLFATIYGLMYLPIYLIIKEQKLSLNELGVTFKPAILPLSIPVGIGLSLLEYSVLGPLPLIKGMELSEIFKLGIVMIFFIGLVEEVIFRALLQKRFEEKIGLIKGLILASLIFGFMHSGYLDFYEIAFASFAGLVLGYCYQMTKNLPFIVIAHGVNNIFLFGILPFLHFLK